MNNRRIAWGVSLGIHALLLAAVPLASPDRTPRPGIIRVVRLPETAVRAVAPESADTTAAVREPARASHPDTLAAPGPQPRPDPPLTPVNAPPVAPIPEGAPAVARQPNELPGGEVVAGPSPPPEETESQGNHVPAASRQPDGQPPPPVPEAAVAAVDDASSAGQAASEAIRKKIRERITAALAYPPAARRRSLEGSAGVRFRIGPDGQPYDIEVGRSSGHALLDRAAIRAVNAGGPFPQVEGDVSVPISFRLE
jgi:protein TonB